MAYQRLNAGAWRAGAIALGLVALAGCATLLGLHDVFRGERPAEAKPSSAAAPATGGKDKMSERKTESAVLAGGCFWCLEAVFEELQGVEKVVSGYSGGRTANPTYEQVCSGTTGHAECVRVTFDPAVLSYHDLLLVFFAFHDPTTLDRQGADAGTQYRSAVFYDGPGQKASAEQVVAELTRQKVFDDPIVTRLAPLGAFYPAEDYHQGYYGRNASQPYCRAVISPKLAKLRKMYAERLKTAP
jgi:peptide-methionine (S)-S-oxide reductase